MSRFVILFTLLSLVAAGCIQPADPVAPASVEPGALTGMLSHRAGELVASPSGWAELQVGLVGTPFSSGEPSVGITTDGTIFITSGGHNIARSTDDGASWEVVTDPILGPKLSLDPWVWVDPITDRVFNAPLYVACTWASWSDDGGDSWDQNPHTGCGLPAHDHQKLTTGPPAAGVTMTSTYPNVVYYQYNSFRDEGSWVSVSLDGGKTYSLGSAAHPSDCHSGIAGPVAVAPDGTAYLAKPACDGLNMAVSRDSGTSWDVTGRVNDVGVASALAVTVDAAVDAAGNAYAVWTGADGIIYLTRSTDAGTSWSAPLRVAPPQVTSTVFSVVSAGSDGRIAVGYLGTTSDTSKWATKNAQDATDDAVWHLYMSLSDDALADDPTFTSVQVTPDADPVQVGCVWQSGGSNPCRNLLDFIDMVLWEGRPYLVFADGCDACSSVSQSRGRDVVIARVTAGPSLVADLLPPVGSTTTARTGALPALSSRAS